MHGTIVALKQFPKLNDHFVNSIQTELEFYTTLFPEGIEGVSVELK